jgi:hypothetical protein
MLRHVAALVVIIVGVHFFLYGALAPWSAVMKRPADWRQIALGLVLFTVGFSVYREASR